MTSVWELFPYLIVGSERWDVDKKFRAQGKGLHAKYGKHGAAATVIHSLVKTFVHKKAFRTFGSSCNPRNMALPNVVS
jgi:hypothetical protein